MIEDVQSMEGTCCGRWCTDMQYLSSQGGFDSMSFQCGEPCMNRDSCAAVTKNT